jgi:hypothetical protein
VLGFDEQKIEAEGLPTPRKGHVPAQSRDRAVPAQSEAAATIGSDSKSSTAQSSPGETIEGYPVYLNGVLRRHGWWYYYIFTLLYKIPEGTWILILMSIAASAWTIRSRAAIAREIILWTVPLVVLFSMSFLTDINLGLRYVLAILPFVFIAAGKVVPWIFSVKGPARQVTGLIAGAALGLAITASLLIHPSYLAYFNWAAGGPDRVPARLIDSNLDWGQDLFGLKRWCRENIPGERIGLAYFGQINPSIFALRGEPLRWFLPPVRPRTTFPMDPAFVPELVGPARRLEPGYYAVSVTLLYGLPWRFYDPAPLALLPAWHASEFGAFTYFRDLTPIKTIGHSINIYRLSSDDAGRINQSLGFRGPNGR